MGTRKTTVSISEAMARQVAAHLERDANELEAAHYHPRFKRVTPKPVRREIARCRRWVTILRAQKQ